MMTEYLYGNNSKVYILVKPFRILFQRTQTGLKNEVSSKTLRIEFFLVPKYRCNKQSLCEQL